MAFFYGHSGCDVQIAEKSPMFTLCHDSSDLAFNYCPEPYGGTVALHTINSIFYCHLNHKTDLWQNKDKKINAITLT